MAYNCAMDVSLKQLEEAVDLKKQINQLQNQLDSLLRGSRAPTSSGTATLVITQPATPRKRRGGLSAAGRERIAAAARARWARAKAGQGSSAPAASAKKSSAKKSSAKKKGGISAAGRKKLSQMMKARWAARRKANS